MSLRGLSIYHAIIAVLIFDVVWVAASGVIIAIEMYLLKRMRQSKR